MLKTSKTCRKKLAVLALSVLALVLVPAGPGQAGVADPRYDAVYSGVPWYDNLGVRVNAHGGQIVYDNGRYYLVGEKRKDNDKSFDGFNLYSSTDLMNWTFERNILPVQPSGLLGPGRRGERPKIMKSPSTGEYVLFMHTDDYNLNDPAIGYATSPTINGTYTFRGPLLYNGSPIRMWDMGAFQDTDGSGYLLLHEGNIYRLASDYRSVTSRIATNFAPGSESPAVFKAGGTYFWLGSGKTSWERNDNTYYTASSLAGPWTSRGTFAPTGSLTRNSQATSVLPIRGSSTTTYMFMGDRWAFPLNSWATYVWQPLTVSGTSISLANYQEAWKVNTSTGVWSPVNTPGIVVDDTVYGTGVNQFNYSGAWTHTSGAGYNGTESKSRTAGNTVSIRFTGTQIKLYGTSDSNQGYATVALLDGNNATVATATLDFYRKNRASNELKYVSPLLTSGTYTLRLTVSGSHGSWTDKAGNVYGSTDDYVAIDRAVINGGGGGDSLVSGATYKIKNAATGKYLDSQGAGEVIATNPHQWNDQDWVVTQQSNGSWTIRNAVTGREYLDTEPNNVVIYNTGYLGPDSQWRLEPTSGGYRLNNDRSDRSYMYATSTGAVRWNTGATDSSTVWAFERK